MLALIFFLPFRAVQYDVNGIEEAQTVEAGRLFQKNHMLYRPVSYAVYNGAKRTGYRGNALGLLQVMDAIFGAMGVGLCYLLCESLLEDKLAALVGAFWLATSFSYWYFSTDAGYIVLAGVFVLAAMLSAVHGRAWPTAILATLAVLTWQANIFAVPVIALLPASEERRGGRAIKTLERHGRGGHSGLNTPSAVSRVLSEEGSTYRRLKVAVATLLLVVAVYVVIALFQGYHTPSSILAWVSTYGEGAHPLASLPLWGKWAWGRIPSASVSALRSIIPILLAARPSELTQHIQLGRIAVDISVLALVVLLALAALRADRKSLIFLAGYGIFLPFIIWWDPYEPKWFVVPNIFFAAFLASSLAPWLGNKSMRILVLACMLEIGATNFITTIRPRHARLGPDREMAQCVADHMTTNDLFLSAQWGWSEYLPYLHNRSMVSLIVPRSIDRDDGIDDTRQRGGKVYFVDPRSYSPEYIGWLTAQTGLTRDILLRFRGTPAFTCNGVEFLEPGS